MAFDLLVSVDRNPIAPCIEIQLIERTTIDGDRFSRRVIKAAERYGFTLICGLKNSKAPETKCS